MIAAALLLASTLGLNSVQTAETIQPLKVVGTNLKYADGTTAHVHGVDVCSMEWTAQGDHVLQSIDVATKQWHANIIRLPLCQDRWFGKTDDSAGANEEAYHELTDAAVSEAAQDGAYIILDLHWSDMDQWGQNIGQHSLPDQNSLTFWQDVAKRYANKPNVIFDLYNEPIKAPWMTWRNGGSVTETFNGQSYTYQAAGMQQLLDTIRAQGARNMVMAGGLGYSSQLYMPDEALLSDPGGNGVLYVSHFYPGWETEDSWEKRMIVATKRFPVIVSEFGDDEKSLPLGSPATRVSRVLSILHAHDWNWLAWSFHTGAGPCLISDWNYTPTPQFGALVKIALAGGTVPIQPRLDTAPDSIIYDDKLEGQWQSWSSATLDLASTDTVHSGTNSIKAAIESDKQIQFGIVPLDGNRFTALHFWVNGGPTGGEQLVVKAHIMDVEQAPVTLDPLTPNTWTEETVTLDQLGVKDIESIKSFTISTTSSTPATIYLDDISLIGKK